MLILRALYEVWLQLGCLRLQQVHWFRVILLPTDENMVRPSFLVYKRFAISNSYVYNEIYLFTTYHCFDEFRDHVAIVHSTSQVGKMVTNIHAWLIVPVRQIIIQFIMWNGLTWIGCTVKCRGIDCLQFTIIADIIALAFVMTINAVSRISDAQLEINRFVAHFFIDHRRFHYRWKEKKFLRLWIGCFAYGHRGLQFNYLMKVYSIKFQVEWENWAHFVNNSSEISKSICCLPFFSVVISTLSVISVRIATSKRALQ